jgi:hypothetical protein
MVVGSPSRVSSAVQGNDNAAFPEEMSTLIPLLNSSRPRVSFEDLKAARPWKSQRVQAMRVVLGFDTGSFRHTEVSAAVLSFSSFHTSAFGQSARASRDAGKRQTNAAGASSAVSRSAPADLPGHRPKQRLRIMELAVGEHVRDIRQILDVGRGIAAHDQEVGSHAMCRRGRRYRETSRPRKWRCEWRPEA